LFLIDQANDPTPAPEAPADGGNVAPVEQPGQPAAQAATPPEGLPEAFWKDGTIDVDSIKALHEASAAEQAKQAARAAEIPADGNYVLTLPEDLKDAEGKPIEIDTANPAYLTLLEAAKELNLTTSEANKFAEMMVRKELEQMKAEQEAASQAMQAELAKLGASPAERIAAVKNSITGILGDKANALTSQILTADGVIALEALVAKINVNPLPAPANGAQNGKRVADIFYGPSNAA
jgi:hypothetical protein